MSEPTRAPRPLDAQTLQAQSEAFARPIESQRKQDVHVVLARIGSSWIAFPAARVLRVTAAVAPHRVPHRRHRALRGLANIEGEIAAVIDFASMCGFEWSPGGGTKARMVVLGERGAAWAFEVDEVPGTFAISADELSVAPVTVSAPHAGFTSGLVPSEHGPAGLVDVDALLMACEGVVRS